MKFFFNFIFKLIFNSDLKYIADPFSANVYHVNFVSLPKNKTSACFGSVNNYNYVRMQTQHMASGHINTFSRVAVHIRSTTHHSGSDHMFLQSD